MSFHYTALCLCTHARVRSTTRTSHLGCVTCVATNVALRFRKHALYARARSSTRLQCERSALSGLAAPARCQFRPHMQRTVLLHLKKATEMELSRYNFQQVHGVHAENNRAIWGQTKWLWAYRCCCNDDEYLYTEAAPCICCTRFTVLERSQVCCKWSALAVDGVNSTICCVAFSELFTVQSSVVCCICCTCFVPAECICPMGEKISIDHSRVCCMCCSDGVAIVDSMVNCACFVCDVQTKRTDVRHTCCTLRNHSVTNVTGWAPPRMHFRKSSRSGRAGPQTDCAECVAKGLFAHTNRAPPDHLK